MFAYGLFIVTLLVMRLAPRSPLGRLLNAALVERPLAKLAGMDQRHLLYLLIVVGFTLFATDMVVMFGSFDLFTLYAWDLAVYFDATLFVFALALVARGRSLLRWLARRGSSVVRRTASRARRTRSLADKAKRGANDDDPAPAWGLAA